MRRSVTEKDITTFSKLNMIYNQIRVLEAKQNSTDYKCLGSGKCCQIGLKIPMAECANIAFSLRQEYYMRLESSGQKDADEWMEGVVDALKEAMHDKDWKNDGETTRHCAFYKGGCTIYGYRPMVCRTFGTITTVDDYCPRIRNAYGGIDFYTGDAVGRIIKSFQDLLQEYAEGKDAYYNTIVYMPLGVLSFLLTNEELDELSTTTDPKFWDGVRGWYNYRVMYIKLHGYGYKELKSFADKNNDIMGFKEEDML